jgi:hypothetical protein
MLLDEGFDLVSYFSDVIHLGSPALSLKLKAVTMYGNIVKHDGLPKISHRLSE